MSNNRDRQRSGKVGGVEMLKNKIALITGGGRGIGAGIAREMAAQGAVVIINYSHSEEAAKQFFAVMSRIVTA